MPANRKRIRTPPIPFDRHTILQAGIAAQQHFTESGVSLPQQGRFIRALEDLTSWTSGNLHLSGRDQLQLRRLRNASLTLLELYVISRAVSPRPGNPGKTMRAKLSRACGGDQIEEEEKSTTARDTQFELLVGAMLSHGGLRVRLERPDLHMLYGDSEVAIEAKRLSSIRKLNRRLKDAVDQIQSSKMSGFVAINLDVLNTELLSRAGHATRFKNRIESTLKRTDRLLYSYRHVLGRLCFARSATWKLAASPRLVLNSQFYFRDYSKTTQFALLARSVFEPACSEMMTKFSDILADLN